MAVDSELVFERQRERERIRINECEHVESRAIEKIKINTKRK